MKDTDHSIPSDTSLEPDKACITAANHSGGAFPPESLSDPAIQMLLGTLLGDGSMSWECKYGRFRVRHGSNQKDYCESKAALLNAYVKTPPRIVPNGGYGKESCVFGTVSSPAFEFLRELCFVKKPGTRDEDRKFERRINPNWLNRLGWEAIAWWYQDDGHLAKGGISRTAVFNTHKFPREEVEMLAAMLTERGIKANAHPSRKEDKVFWTIRLTAPSTRVFVKKIEAFVHPTLRYKLDAPERDLPNCDFCGGIVDTRHINRRRPCCRKPECQRARNRERNARYANKPGQREINNARSRANRAANLEKLREKARESRAARESDPEYRQKWNLHRSNWKKKKLQDPAYKARDLANKRAWWARKAADPAWRALRNQKEAARKLARKEKEGS